MQPRSIDGAIVSSVVPSINNRLFRKLQRITGGRPLFVDHRFSFPFAVRVGQPRQLGADRLCAAAGALRHGARSAVIVDVGSAITVDGVARGSYRGGLILPGLSAGLEALGAGAEKLPRIAGSRLTRAAPGRPDGTRESMIAGVAVGAAGAIKEAVAYVRRTTGPRARVFVTGGAARVVRARLPRSWCFDPTLVQEGLYLLWKMNSSHTDT